MGGPPFHNGEREAQRRAGFRVDTAPIRQAMPDHHRAFFATLRFAPMAVMASDGQPLASVLWGEPGFIASPSPHILQISAAAPPVPEGTAVGLIGIDFATGRRNRVNGRIHSVHRDGMSIAVDQSFGNCPKYIHRRDVVPVPPESPVPTKTLDRLEGGVLRLIESADTLFVASCSGSEALANGGADISHRGGPAGFIQVDGNRLTIPDYAGNRYMNTFGNFLINPRAALLFIDFDTGDLLHLTGAVKVDFDAKSWTVYVTTGWFQQSALPLRWTHSS